MTQLDPSIVERYAEHLQRKASSRVIGYTIAFALLGSILGSAPLVAPNRVLIPHSLGIALLLVGAAAGGYLGYTIGLRRAEGLQLQALVTLHQIQVERALVQTVTPLLRQPRRSRLRLRRFPSQLLPWRLRRSHRRPRLLRRPRSSRSPRSSQSSPRPSWRRLPPRSLHPRPPRLHHRPRSLLRFPRLPRCGPRRRRSRHPRPSGLRSHPRRPRASSRLRLRRRPSRCLRSHRLQRSRRHRRFPASSSRRSRRSPRRRRSPPRTASRSEPTRDSAGPEAAPPFSAPPAPSPAMPPLSSSSS